jgi:hypothetical protein
MNEVKGDLSSRLASRIGWMLGFGCYTVLFLQQLCSRQKIHSPGLNTFTDNNRKPATPAGKG